MANTPGTPTSSSTPDPLSGSASLTGSGSGTGGSSGGESGNGLGGTGSSGAGLGSASTGGSFLDPTDAIGIDGSSLGADQTTPSSGGSSSGLGTANRRAEARSRFNAALDEARAGLDALRADAAHRGASYRALATDSTSDWVEEVKAITSDARKRAEDMATQGKTRASDSLSSLGKILSETAPVIDERLGAKYGDFARSAARSIQESAARLEAKELVEMGDDIRAMVKKSPAAAVGVAAVAGFFVARLFGAGKN